MKTLFQFKQWQTRKITAIEVDDNRTALIGRAIGCVIDGVEVVFVVANDLDAAAIAKHLGDDFGPEDVRKVTLIKTEGIEVEVATAAQEAGKQEQQTLDLAGEAVRPEDGVPVAQYAGKVPEEDDEL